MSPALKQGLPVDFSYTVPNERTVPFLLPESQEFKAMPAVLATGYMVGLFEWACILAVNPFLNWPAEQTVGIDVKLNHTSPTPPGMTVRISGSLVEVQGRKLLFALSGHDGEDMISEGFHTRYIIDFKSFCSRVQEKADRNLPAGSNSVN